MRGDRPLPTLCENVHRWFTPHARGSTLDGYSLGAFFVVYPACAGIDRGFTPSGGTLRGLPRMRGDRPLVGVIVYRGHMFTPHARGSTFVDPKVGIVA